MSKTIKDGSKPDLEFYWNYLLQNITETYSDKNVGTYIGQNILYKDKDLKIPIGNYLFNFIQIE